VESRDANLRRATAADVDAVADVWLRSYAAALPTVRRAHSDDEVRAWVRDVVVPDRETWVATVDDVVAAMMVLHDGDIDQMYVDPSHQDRGIGGRLIELGKQRFPAGLALWTFQVNDSAHRFYERHGFVTVERTDGSGNEEREPDVRYVWRPAS
jgi:GNAT superfamily N-acetyltransferase